MAGGVVGKLTTAGTGAGTHLLSNTFYGTCDTAAATAAKIVKLADTGVNAATLITGMQLSVKFTYANGVANPTLTVQTNGGTELIAAKSIMRYGTTAPSTSAASSWRAGAVVNFVYDGTNWVEVSSIDDNSTYYTQCVNITTAAATAAKIGSCSYYNLANNHYFMAMIVNANTVQGALTLNINSAGAKPIYINGAASSASNYTLPNGMYLVYYNGTNYYFRTDTYIQGNFAGSLSGNASTATKLYTARSINGTSFDGSADITTANWGTARTITIGSTGKSVNGSANVSWSLSEIGAAASSHTHSYLPLSGGTLTGAVTNTYSNISFIASHGTADSSAGFMATRTDTGASISLMVGSNGTNRGVYDSTNSAWVLYTDGSNTVAQRGTLYTNAISASGSLTASSTVSATYGFACTNTSYTPSSLANLTEIMSSIYARMSDRSSNIIHCNPSVSFSPFGGGNFFVVINRSTSTYGSATAIEYAGTRYATSRGARIFSASLNNGTWSSWTEPTGYLYANNTVSYESDVSSSHQIQYLSGSLPATAGSGATYSTVYYPSGMTSTSGSSANVQILRLTWGSTYFHEIFFSPNNHYMYRRMVQGGGAFPWYRMYDTENITKSTSTPSGGVDGDIWLRYV